MYTGATTTGDAPSGNVALGSSSGNNSGRGGSNSGNNSGRGGANSANNSSRGESSDKKPQTFVLGIGKRVTEIHKSTSNLPSPPKGDLGAGVRRSRSGSGSVPKASSPHESSRQQQQSSPPLILQEEILISSKTVNSEGKKKKEKKEEILFVKGNCKS